ncbi:hypothetical protein Ahos_1025 [Acidianus hospitalis W1]|jgi:hypothetical protein|uniref:Uncharacterized protein n=1 Tax=Acidianus hospitalis (strain W1) TaxID=933801 RepID=F4B9B8_ACIHW|nr:hypothetical protein Ahos_1025 [Acidianus hospitalis W1]
MSIITASSLFIAYIDYIEVIKIFIAKNKNLNGKRKNVEYMKFCRKLVPHYLKPSTSA